jgi:hypothetical protein
MRQIKRSERSMAFPIIDLEFGRKLTDQEANEVFEQNIKHNEDFKKIVAEVEKLNGSVGEIKILAANKVEFVTDPEDGVTFVTKIVIKIGGAVINYQLTTRNGASKEHVMGALLNQEQKLTSVIVVKGEIEATVYEYDGELEKDFSEGLPNNENYVPGQSLKAIGPQWSFSDLNVCYPGYRHCGKGCGDNGPVGGGTPVDSYDSCCRAHDRCWATFGTNDCGCDCELESCAKKNWYEAPPALHTALLAYFPVEDSCRC